MPRSPNAENRTSWLTRLAIAAGHIYIVTTAAWASLYALRLNTWWAYLLNTFPPAGGCATAPNIA